MMELHLQSTLSGGQGNMAFDVQLQLQAGAFVGIMGPSGSGKTSLLRMVAGLMQPEAGRIVVNGTPWLDAAKGIVLSPQQRSVGMVFQDYALFPHLDVEGNLRFALPRGGKEGSVEELMEHMELAALRKRKPATLSGGQQQRVALARALVQRPSVLLLDEPLSALDRTMRVQLQDYLLQLHREYGLITLLVSHDVAEVARLGSHVVVLENGRVARQGSPAEVLTQRSLSGKFQFVGEVLRVEPQEVLSVLTILIGNELARVVVSREEAEALSIGDQVLVASKAFNPVVRKI